MTQQEEDPGEQRPGQSDRAIARQVRALLREARELAAVSWDEQDTAHKLRVETFERRKQGLLGLIDLETQV